MLIIRASSLDRILACSGSLEETEAPYNPLNPEANEGTAGHEALRAIGRGLDPDVDAIAQKYGIKASALADIVRRGVRIWDELAPFFTGDIHADDETFEAELAPGVVLRGTPDLMAVSKKKIVLNDWKAGWGSAVHPNQLAGYAYLARCRYGMPASGYINGAESWVRHGTYEWHKFTDADLDRLRERILTQVRHRGRQFGPGPDACLYCPLQNSCVARAEWVRSAATALVPVAQNQPVTRETIGLLYPRVRQLEAAIRSYHSVLDAMLAEGPLPVGDGQVLKVVTEEQDRLVAELVLPWLRDELGLSDSDLGEAISISKTAVTDVVSARAKKGKAAGAVREAFKRLRELGAIGKTTKRTKKVVDDDGGCSR